MNQKTKINWVNSCTGLDLYIENKRVGSITFVVTNNKLTFLIKDRGSFTDLEIAKDILLELKGDTHES